MNNVTKEEGKLIPVKRSTVVGSQYAQSVGVSVTEFDITLEFSYINPQESSDANVVARVTMPRIAGEGVAKLIADMIALHEAKKRSEKN
jgi:hypothetical protein